MDIKSTQMTSIEGMREVFNGAQHLHRHNKCIKDMHSLYTQHSLDVFKTEFIRNMKMTLWAEKKSPFTKHVIEFMSRFLLSTSTNDSMTADENQPPANNNNNNNDNTIIYSHGQEEDDDKDVTPDDLGLESFGRESFECIKVSEPTLLDMILKETVINCLYSLDPGCRFNACALVNKIFMHLQDVDNDVYESLRKALLDRCADKERSIRAAAAKALHRFQEADDPKDRVIAALNFHLKNDPDADVRQACLMSIQPTKETTDDYIHATRDVKDIIRKTAFTIIADKIHIKKFTIEQRLIILKNALHERSAAVKRTVETKLIPSWVKAFDGQLVDLLISLDIQSDPELVSKMLFSYFKFSLNDELQDGKNAFFKLIDDFRDKYLDEKRLVTKVALTSEMAFLWRALAQFCKENEITIKIPVNINQITDEQMVGENVQVGECDAQSHETQEEEIEILEMIIPDLPYFCAYITKFMRQVANNEHEVEELMEYEFMFLELLKICSFYEIGDDMQRQILYKHLNNILMNKEFSMKIHNYISPIMKCFANNILHDSSTLLNFTVDTIDEIRDSIKEVEEQRPPSSQDCNVNNNNTEQLRQYEMEYAKIFVQINEWGDKLDEAKKHNDFIEAQRIKEVIDELNHKKEDIMQRRLGSNSSEVKSSQASQQPKPEISLSDHPEELERCLNIFCGCLEYGQFKEVNSMMLALIEKVCMTGFTCLEPRIRNIAVKCLGLTCMISVQLATRYFGLFLQAINFDTVLIQETALKCIFDFLCVHGFHHFDQNAAKANQSKILKSNAEKDDHNHEIDRNDGDGDDEGHEDDVDFDKTIIDDNEYDDDENDANTKIDDEEEDFTKLITGLFMMHLNSESDDIKLVVAQGIGKLLLLGRIYSSSILTKLIVMWYDPDITSELRQFLGVFLPIYASVKTRNGYEGQLAFEESFIPTIEYVHLEGLNYVNLDNMINFLLDILQDERHRKLALPIANKILTLTPKSELASRYFLRALSLLRFNEMEAQDLKDFKVLLRKLKASYSKAKGVPKTTLAKIETIEGKVKRQLDQLQLNLSQTLLIENFGTPSSSQQTPRTQTESQPSEIFETPTHTPIK